MRLNNLQDILRLKAILYCFAFMVFPILNYGQGFSQLQRIVKVHSNGDNVDFTFDPIHRFKVNSAHYFGYISLDNEPSITWDYFEDFPWGYSSISPEQIQFTTPTLAGPNIRTCIFNRAGYPLAELYSLESSPFNYASGIRFAYDDEMKLLSKVRYQSNPPAFWKVDYLYDELGRRIEELHSSSQDSVNWVLTSKNLIHYSGEMWDTAKVFEKYSHYVPETLFFSNSIDYFIYYPQWFYPYYDPPYLDDEWKIDYYTRYSYQNGAWGDPYIYPLYMREEQGDFVFYWDWVEYTYSYEGIIKKIWGYIEEPDNWYITFFFSLPTLVEDELNPMAQDTELQISPNPFHDSVNLEFDMKQSDELRTKIYNSKGQLVKTYQNVSSAIGHNSLSWDGKNQSGKPCGAGIYIVQIQGKHTQLVKKIMKL